MLLKIILMSSVVIGAPEAEAVEDSDADETREEGGVGSPMAGRPIIGQNSETARENERGCLPEAKGI